MRGLTIKSRIITGFTSVIILMALIVILVGIQFARVQYLAETIISEMSMQISSSNAVINAVSKESNLRAYALTGDRRYYDEYHAGAMARQSAAAQLRKILVDPAGRKVMTDMDSRLRQLNWHEEQVLNYINEGNKARAYDHYRSHIQPLTASILDDAARITSSGYDRLKAAGDEFTIQKNRLGQYIWAFFVSAIILTLIFIVATVRAVTRPARIIAEAARAVECGDYSKALGLAKKVGSSDTGSEKRPRNEFGVIAAALSSMAKALKQREKALVAHAGVSSVCASTIEIDTLLNKALAELADHTGYHAAVAYLADGSNFEPRAFYGISPETSDKINQDPTGCVQLAAELRKPVIIRDVSAETGFAIQTGIGKITPRSIAYVPLVAEDTVMGVIAMASANDYDEGIESLMSDAAIQISIALSNALKHAHVRELVDELEINNEQLNEKNDCLQCQNEEIQAQTEQIEVQNEELLAQTAELQERNAELESLTRDLFALQSVTAVALSSLDQEELLQGLLETVCSALYLQLGLIMLLDGDEGRLQPVVAYNLGEIPKRSIALGESLAGEVALQRKIIYTTDARAHLEALDVRPPVSSAKLLAGLPLISGDRLCGVALLGSSEPRTFTEREEQLLLVFAERCAIAIERSEAFRLLEQAQNRASTERQHLQAVIDNLPEAVVIVSARDGRIDTMNKAALEVHGLNEVPNVSAEEFYSVHNMYHLNGQPFDPEEIPIIRSLNHGEACLGIEAAIRKQPSSNDIIVICDSIPLRNSAGAITGAVGVLRDITSIKEQQAVLQEICEKEQKIAETLQKSFLPPELPNVPGYEIGHVYRAAYQDAQVGGDFYDIIEMDGNRLGVVMGDVSGKGVAAAVHTAMAKYMLRAFAHENPEPAAVLRRVNAAMAHYMPHGMFVTMFYGVLHLQEGRLVYANAGHELPICLKSAEGACIKLASTGPAAGILPNANYEQREITISDGDAFVIYTDGITEARRGKQFLGSEGLEHILSRIRDANAWEMADTILASVQDFSGDNLLDDAALVVIKPVKQYAD